MQNKNKKAKRNFRKRLTGVRFKFVGLTTALVVVLLALLNSYPVQSSRDMVFSEKQTAMTNQAGTAASSLASLDHLSRESIAEVLNLLELDNYERVLVTNEKGRVLYDSAAEENQTGQQPEIKAIARAMEGKTSFYSRFTSEAFFSHVAVPILRDAKVIGAVYLDEKDEEQAGIITGIQSRIRTISAFICILALLADILMTSLLTKRIVTLAEMTKKVAEGDYSQRFLTQGEDEVAELGREFNRLTQRLETTEKQRRQFVSDASHELKTPIAAITLLADSIVQNENMDEETIREFVTDIVHESNRLQKMTEELAGYLYIEKILGKTNAGHGDYLFCPAPYTPRNDRNFYLIQDVYDLIRSAGGCYGPYRGVLLVDVTEWAGHFREKYFDIFLSYLADLRMDGTVPFFFADSRKAESDMDVLNAVISSYFLSIPIIFNTEELREYAVSMLADKGVLMDDSALEYLGTFLREASRSPLFHGTESVGRICESILLKRGKKAGSRPMNGQNLKNVIAASGYDEIYKEKAGKTIGFR